MTSVQCDGERPGRLTQGQSRSHSILLRSLTSQLTFLLPACLEGGLWHVEDHGGKQGEEALGMGEVEAQLGRAWEQDGQGCLRQKWLGTLWVSSQPPGSWWTDLCLHAGPGGVP